MNVLVTLEISIHGNLKEYQKKKNNKNPSRSEKTFAPTLINCYVLPDAKLNGERYFCFLKSNKSTYFLYAISKHILQFK